MSLFGASDRIDSRFIGALQPQGPAEAPPVHAGHEQSRSMHRLIQQVGITWPTGEPHADFLPALHLAEVLFSHGPYMLLLEYHCTSPFLGHLDEFD